MNKIFLILSLLLFNFSSIVSAEMILAEEAKEMLDEHVKQSALLKVPLPKDNRVIKNYDRYKDIEKIYLLIITTLQATCGKKKVIKV